MSASPVDVSSLKGAAPHEFDHDLVDADAGSREALSKAIHVLVIDLLLSTTDLPREGSLTIDFAVVRDGSHDQRVVTLGQFARKSRSTALVRRL